MNLQKLRGCVLWTSMGSSSGKMGDLGSVQGREWLRTTELPAQEKGGRKGGEEMA